MPRRNPSRWNHPNPANFSPISQPRLTVEPAFGAQVPAAMQNWNTGVVQRHDSHASSHLSAPSYISTSSSYSSNRSSPQLAAYPSRPVSIGSLRDESSENKYLGVARPVPSSPSHSLPDVQHQASLSKPYEYPPARLAIRSHPDLRTPMFEPSHRVVRARDTTARNSGSAANEDWYQRYPESAPPIPPKLPYPT